MQTAKTQLYAALFRSGLMKVGKGKKALARILAHARLASCHNNPIVAYHLEENPRITEAELIRFCRRYGIVASGREWFTGLHYDVVVGFLRRVNPQVNASGVSVPYTFIGPDTYA